VRLTLRAWRILLRMTLVVAVLAGGAAGAYAGVGEYLLAGAWALVAFLLWAVLAEYLVARVRVQRAGPRHRRVRAAR
jgi:hypothetical protein